MEDLTFDHNIIIDLEGRRKSRYTSLCSVLEKHFERVAITAVSASENPPVNNFKEFKEKIIAIPELRQIKDEQILKPLCITDFSYYDYCLLGDESMVKLERKIASALFSDDLFPIKSFNKSTRRKLADVMTFWCHVYYKRGYFVTSDTDFLDNIGSLKEIAQNYHNQKIKILKPSELSNQIN